MHASHPKSCHQIITRSSLHCSTTKSSVQSDLLVDLPAGNVPLPVSQITQVVHAVAQPQVAYLFASACRCSTEKEQSGDSKSGPSHSMYAIFEYIGWFGGSMQAYMTQTRCFMMSMTQTRPESQTAGLPRNSPGVVVVPGVVVMDSHLWQPQTGRVDG